MHNATPKVHLLTVTVVRRLVAALPNLEVASVPVEVGPSRFMSARHEDRLAYDLYALCSGTDRTKRQKRVDVRVDVRVRFASARLAAPSSSFAVLELVHRVEDVHLRLPV